MGSALCGGEDVILHTPGLSEARSWTMWVQRKGNNSLYFGNFKEGGERLS